VREGGGEGRKGKRGGATLPYLIHEAIKFSMPCWFRTRGRKGEKRKDCIFSYSRLDSGLFVRTETLSGKEGEKKKKKKRKRALTYFFLVVANCHMVVSGRGGRERGKKRRNVHDAFLG